jgi:hypothetical protein
MERKTVRRYGPGRSAVSLIMGRGRILYSLIFRTELGDDRILAPFLAADRRRKGGATAGLATKMGR